MREKFLWAGIVIIIISGIGNYIYFQSKQLDEPVFLDHYVKRSYYDEKEVPITFYYLVDKLNPVTVNSVEIDGVELYPEAGSGITFWSGDQPQINYVQEFSHQYLTKIRLHIPVQEIPAGGSWSFRKVTAYLSNGKQMEADIGVVLITKRDSGENPDVFKTMMGTSSNQHTEEKSLVAKQSLTINEINVPFSDEIGDDVAIKIDLDQERLKDLERSKHSGKVPDWVMEKSKSTQHELLDVSALPLTLKDNEWVSFFMQFNPNRQSYLDLEMEIKGTMESGEAFIRPLLINDHPRLEQDDVSKIIAKKGGDAG